MWEAAVQTLRIEYVNEGKTFISTTGVKIVGLQPVWASGHNPKARTRIPDRAILDDSHSNFGRLLEELVLSFKAWGALQSILHDAMHGSIMQPLLK